ncbi:unnamed protein product [Ambrosiozyma monospora]|uniref:Unnamed protein product n=1 Tax=Ambrosiozyma monospora TaxID=43982 RepID=A0ACB5T618_AMBMO|nr:unnamed protein product [Ambrosiozyma monospora]
MMPINMLATGIYFGIDEVVSFATDNIGRDRPKHGVRHLCFDLLNSKNYGSISQRLFKLSESFVLKFGWQESLDKWDSLSGELVSKIVGSSLFFVSNEYERATFLIKLFGRRKTVSRVNNTVNDLEHICDALNENFSYSTLDLNELQKISEANKNNRNPLKPGTLLAAAWLSSELQFLVKSTPKSSTELEG